ncbi:hypothetical protein L915_01741, partial [Phytophthora nicotianae]
IGGAGKIVEIDETSLAKKAEVPPRAALRGVLAVWWRGTGHWPVVRTGCVRQAY